MGLLKQITSAFATGASYGRAAKIVQGVFGRNLTPGERDLFQNYCGSMKFRADMDPNEMALDFLVFLLAKDPHPSGITPPKLTGESREILKQVIVDGINKEAISIQGDNKGDLIRWIEGK